MKKPAAAKKRKTRKLKLDWLFWFLPVAAAVLIATQVGKPQGHRSLAQDNSANDCSQEQIQSARALASGKDPSQRVLGQVHIFHCSTLANFSNIPSAVLMDKAAQSFALLMSNPGASGESAYKICSDLRSQIADLLKTDSPGNEALAAAAESLRQAQENYGPWKSMFQVLRALGSVSDDLTTHFCKWKSKVETAAPGSTQLFPKDLLAC